MSDKLPRSSQPHIQRTLRRKKFFAVTDDLAKQSQIPSLLQSEHMQTTTPLPAISNNGSLVQPQAQAPASLLSKEMQTTAPLLVAATNSGTSVTAVSVSMQASFLLPTVELSATQRKSNGVNNHSQTWKPGTFGFENGNDMSPFEKEETFSMIVLKGISKQQGQSTPVMQSEISGAASSVAIVGVGTTRRQYVQIWQ